MDYLNDNTGAWGFGLVARSSYNSTIQSGFYGRGDVDGFTRKYFNISVQELAFLFEGYACTTTTSK